MSETTEFAMNNKFERIMQIADFAAKRQQDRRQYEFRIFIAYVTLIALAIYKSEAIDGSCYVMGSFVGLSYFLYLLWLLRVSRANLNDGYRRNFYLEKAEDMLYSRYVRIKNEYEEENGEENRIRKVPKILQVCKGWDAIFNWSVGFTAFFPLLLVILLVYQLCCCWNYVVKSIIIMIAILAILAVISCKVLCGCKNKRNK